MADTIIAEKLDSTAASGRFESKTIATSLWCRENFEALSGQPVASKLTKVDFVSPDESVGIIARGADGFALFDSSLASTPEQRGDHALASKSPDVWYHEPIVEAQKIVHDAHVLTSHHKQSPYALVAPPKGFPKCNLFIYDVMDRAGVPLPHGPQGERLTSANLDKALSNDRNFELVWERNPNENTWLSERFRFWHSYKPQDGDIAIWNNKHLEHTCLLEETINGQGNTYYAGRDTEDGLGHMPLKEWWVDSTVKGYGAPDAVYRYKHFVR